MKTSLNLSFLAIAVMFISPASADEDRPLISLRMTAMIGDPEFRAPVLAAVRETVARIPELELTDAPDADFICTVTAMRFDTTNGPAGMVLALVFMTNGGTKLMAAEMLNNKLITPDAASKIIGMAKHHTTQDTGVKDFSTVRTLAMNRVELGNQVADVFSTFRQSLIQQRCSAEKAITLKALKDISKAEIPRLGAAEKRSP